MTAKLRVDFVAVGPQRTGTSWLDEALRAHPEVSLPQQVKETMFFDERFRRGMDWYASHFDLRDAGTVRGEIAPTYFDMDAAAARLEEHNPACRIIVTLRDPRERAISLYRHHRAKGRVHGSFSRAIEQMPRIVESGHYAEHVPRWLERFGRERVHFVTTDDISNRPEGTLTDVCRFLGVAAADPPASIGRVVNPSTAPRYPVLAALAARAATGLRAARMHRVVEAGKALGLERVFDGGGTLPEATKDEVEELSHLYADDIRYVEELLGRNLGWGGRP